MEVLVINSEECRMIAGFERYHVSESGRVYRTDTHKPRSWRTKGKVYISENKVHYNTKRRGDSQGFVSLTNKEGKLRHLLLAPLVAYAFGVTSEPLDIEKQTIAYKDGNVQNLHFTNLHVVDRIHSNSKLTKEDVKHIKKQIRMGIPLRKIAWFFSVSEMQINRIKTGENWGNGKRKIKAPTAPFEIEDGKMRRYIATFDQKETSANIKKPFTIKRNEEDPVDNTIVGIVNGYKLSIKHSNITRARHMVEKLNDYFFSVPKVTKKMSDSIFKE